MEKYNLPPKVRFAIYVLLGLGGIVATYLSAINVIGQNELTAWSAFSVFVGGLAAVNVTPEAPVEEDDTDVPL